MSRRSWGGGMTLLMLVTATTLASLAACGTKDNRSFDGDGGTAATPAPGAEGGPVNAEAQEAGAVVGTGTPGVGYSDAGCNPLTCKSGCCSGDGTCLPGTAPAECGKGGLICVNCAAVGYGCVSQGCSAAATCTGCDGCCKAGTCNPNGKTQDNACGHGGAVCTDCTGNSETCDGNGNCH